MKNKGFTLVEVLGVIIILAILFILIFPSVSNIIFQGEQTVYQAQINKILNAAYDLSLKNINYLPEYDEKKYMTLGELKYEGMIDIDVKNPITNDFFEDNLVISIYNVGAGYKYFDSNSKLEGNYLYTVETDKLTDSTIKNYLPKIILEGENLIQNSNGEYMAILDLYEEFSNTNYTAVSHDEIDLTNRVKKYILMNDQAVETIDSSKSSIYKIKYSVIDDKGYASVITLNVIIADKTPPEITLPGNIKINLTSDKIDLMAGVKCTDNSGFCDITTSDEIDYSIIGKQIITYTAKDPSGNTSTKKRVITIE